MAVRRTHRSPPQAAPPRRGAPERLAAWLVTGPLGHLYGTLADIVEFAVRLWRDRLARGLGRARGRGGVA